MKIKSLKYSQYNGADNEWKLEETTFGDINLIVGKNASGKTRTLNVLNAVGNLLSGRNKPTFKSGDFRIIFEHKGKTLKYQLEISDGQVTKEILMEDSETLLKRGKNGKGTIFNKTLDDMVAFQAPQNELVSATRRDSIQHPFFEELYSWAKNSRMYKFSSSLGKDTAMLRNENESTSNDEEILEGDNNVIQLFEKGKKEFGSKFITSVKKDLAYVGFSINEINIGTPSSYTAKMKIYGLTVLESGLSHTIDQNDMSQGMFRALSLIIQMNYYSFSKKTSCIFIDDIGEGLDYERSTNLIKLLIKKAEAGGFQLIMSTNDRFVMNNVPLKYWTVIERLPKAAKMHNYSNSKIMFDEFEYTGLNNFDFFAKDFLKTDLNT